jgi:two-component system NarL family response regulator
VAVQVPDRGHPNNGKPGGNGPIRVLLADDHPVVRWGLMCCLEHRTDIQVVGEACDGLEAVRKAKALAPQVILMDIEMPELDGLTATELLRRDHPEIKVLLLSMHSYSRHMHRILQSGARGFLLKNSRPNDIIAAIFKAAAGETCFSADIAQQALGHLANALGGEAERKPLSVREREVLIGIAEGLSNKQLAQRLRISARTIETHRCHIMQKLHIRSVAGLTRYAISQGLVVLDNEPAPKAEMLNSEKLMSQKLKG